MSDLFPGFEEHTITGDGADIYLRKGGSGPPLLLVHGFPESHMMWHKMAPALSEHFTLVIPDLRGYGRSSRPGNDPENYTYSKRAMGRDLFAVMTALGYEKFAICGHDRGARVTYRMALDEPSRITRICVLDIIPTYAMWHGMDHAMAMKTYHWPFLAQPYPLPETLIGGCPEFYIENKMSAWNGRSDLDVFDPVAMADYKAHFSQPEVIHALCNDYRAGETYDLKADEEDRQAGKRISCPVLALWGDKGIPSEGKKSALEIWREWADDVAGGPVASGHFLPEENPEDTLSLVLPFFKSEQT